MTEEISTRDNIQESTEQANKPDSSRTWSQDSVLESALRVDPSLNVDRGKTITFSFDPTSPYASADEGYTYQWRIHGRPDIQVGTDNIHSIDTRELEVKNDYRILCEVRKGGDINTVLAFINVKEALTSHCALNELCSYVQRIDSLSFIEWATAIFGNDIPNNAYEKLYIELKNHTVESVEIEVCSGSYTAYDSELHKIIVDTTYIYPALEGKPSAVWMLYHIMHEEFGRHIDYLLRNKYSNVGGTADSTEGNSFALQLGKISFSEQKEFVFANFKGSGGEWNLMVGSEHETINSLVHG